MSTARVLDALAVGGWTFAASVPDKGLTPLLEAIDRDRRFIHVPCTREEEGVGLCAGAYLGGRRGVLLMQSSGLGNCVNAFASLLGLFDVPLMLFVSLRGSEGEQIAAQLPMGRITRPLLRLSGFALHEPASAGDLIGEISRASGRAVMLAPPDHWLRILEER